jgi:triphosphoribosyl-dephospho-CoA synthetase
LEDQVGFLLAKVKRLEDQALALEGALLGTLVPLTLIHRDSPIARRVSKELASEALQKAEAVLGIKGPKD